MALWLLGGQKKFLIQLSKAAKTLQLRHATNHQQYLTNGIIMTLQEMSRQKIAQILGQQLLAIVDQETDAAFLKARFDEVCAERDRLMIAVTKPVATEEAAQKPAIAKTKGVNHS
jgi:hypothetical protein